MDCCGCVDPQTPLLLCTYIIHLTRYPSLSSLPSLLSSTNKQSNNKQYQQQLNMYAPRSSTSLLSTRTSSSTSRPSKPTLASHSRPNGCGIYGHHHSRTVSTNKNPNDLPPFQGFDQPSWSVSTFLKPHPNSTPVEQFTEDQLKHLASLSRLSLADPKRLSQFSKDLEEMLVFVSHIQSVNTTDVQPLHSLLENQSLKLAKDEPDPEQEPKNSEKRIQEITSNASHTLRGFFVVPKVK